MPGRDCGVFKKKALQNSCVAQSEGQKDNEVLQSVFFSDNGVRAVVCGHCQCPDISGNCRDNLAADSARTESGNAVCRGRRRARLVFHPGPEPGRPGESTKLLEYLGIE